MLPLYEVPVRNCAGCYFDNETWYMTRERIYLVLCFCVKYHLECNTQCKFGDKSVLYHNCVCGKSHITWIFKWNYGDNYIKFMLLLRNFLQKSKTFHYKNIEIGTTIRKSKDNKQKL